MFAKSLLAVPFVLTASTFLNDPGCVPGMKGMSDSHERGPLVILVSSNSVECGCEASTSVTGVNDDKEVCPPPTNILCVEIVNQTPPAAIDGECSQVAGVECEERSAMCEFSFRVDVHYAHQCCCGGAGGSDTVVVHYDNYPFVPYSSRTVNLGDVVTVTAINKLTCSAAQKHSGHLNIKVRCSDSSPVICEIDFPTTCEQCKKL